MKSNLRAGSGTARVSVFQWATNLWFLFVSVAMIVPLLLVVSISLTDEQSLAADGYRFIAGKWSTEAYRYILQSPTILLRAYLVTIVVTVVGTVLSLLLTAMIGFVISRRDFKFQRIATFYVFFTMLFSGGLVPSYILITQYLHLKDSIWALILPGMISAFYVMVMKGFMREVPFEIIESAKVDGASEFRVFFAIMLPLSKPALATLGLFISFNYWNSWFGAMIYINKESLVPIQLLLVRMMENLEFLATNQEFLSQVTTSVQNFPNVSARMAMVILAAGPMMLVFPFFQKYFVKGLTVGSLKG
ncbi:carbohydrate ABC transporter permease [Paenibacillus koleovorans]|uniref:carbohydrate ABC transporter permease n=1 Tax=Paenibacillus koleovorans TaxID=121608 RepID=UPI000FDC0EBB|nr:carbohydrate ABC transporter permease [Paenibacillus koleovorans]